MRNELVNVYVKTANGCELLYKDISEDIALEFWKIGFKTGENKILIERKERKADKEFLKRQIEKLHNC